MMEARHQIGFEQAGLGSVLKQNQLVVPPNQREYAWRADREVRQLFQDFGKAINEGVDYFLGTIVTIPRMNGALEVVDGQQRLATAAILLAAIRDYLKDKNEDVLVESIDNEFLTGIDRTKRARISKLSLNIDDNELFNWIVASSRDDPAPAVRRASHERLLAALAEAQKHVGRIVATLDVKDHGDLLNGWVSFVEHRALVVLLRVPDGADAYKMFETLNDRGLRTNQADLIKNYLFGRSEGRLGEVQTRWAYMRGALESLDDDITIDFLRHALMVLRGHVRESEVYDVVQDVVRTEQAAVTFSSTLENLANIYVATFNPEHERWNGYPDAARRAIEVFNLLNIRPMRPLILALASKMAQREASGAFQFLVSLGVRLLVAATTRSGSVEVPLAETAHAVSDAKIETAADLRAALAAITPTDQEFREAFETARVSNARLARYYLRSMEMTAKNEPEPWFMPTDDRSVINLEHVLPKKPEGNWPQFTEDDVEFYCTRLGNLALMRATENSDIRSAPFADKKQLFAASPYLLTSQIAGLDDWTPASIGDRQRQLAAIAVSTWPVTT
jgi:hypothetical protein